MPFIYLKKKRKQKYGELLDGLPDRFRIKCKFFRKELKTPLLGLLSTFAVSSVTLLPLPVFPSSAHTLQES